MFLVQKTGDVCKNHRYNTYKKQKLIILRLSTPNHNNFQQKTQSVCKDYVIKKKS